MQKFPFEIPPSLYTYVEQFEEDPERITEKLEAHLEKRGQDAVGQFLLAWFYHARDMQDKAIKRAVKARALAPGSPLLEFLPYYMKHPKSLEAWSPAENHESLHITEPFFNSSPSSNNLDLDLLIEKLTKSGSKRIHPDEASKAEEAIEENKIEEEKESVDEIISETLASIYENHGQYKKALDTYQKLKDRFPQRLEKYDEAISRLENKLENATE